MEDEDRSSPQAPPYRAQDEHERDGWECDTCAIGYPFSNPPGPPGPYRLGEDDWCINCIRRHLEYAIGDEQRLSATYDDEDGVRHEFDIDVYAAEFNDVEFLGGTERRCE